MGCTPWGDMEGLNYRVSGRTYYRGWACGRGLWRVQVVGLFLGMDAVRKRGEPMIGCHNHFYVEARKNGIYYKQ